MNETSRQPLLIGLTGGIACGKSTVADLFAKLGVPVIDTDLIAREVVEPGAPALEQIVSVFGREALDASGRLDRDAMRERVFAEPDARRTLESIVHPRIRECMWRRVGETHSAYVILVIPLLFETGQQDRMDRVLVVDVPESTQIDRAMSRDSSGRETIQGIMDRQASRAIRRDNADDIIVNDRDVDALRSHVVRLDGEYRQRAARLRLARDK